MSQAANDKGRRFTREEVFNFLNDVSRQLEESQIPPVHTMLALNTMFRAADAKKIFDDELKEKARALWLRIKATGVQVIDPPILFEADLDAIAGEEEIAEEDEQNSTNSDIQGRTPLQ